MRRSSSLSLPVLIGSALVACSGGEGRESDSESGASGIASVSVSVSVSVSASASASGGESDSGSGSSGTESAGSDSAASDSAASDSAASDSQGSGVDEPKFDLGDPPDFPPKCDGVGGMIDESYIWIPSTSDGWVSKINTRTLVEEARYYTGPSGGSESVSRTAVSGDGRFVVVNSRGTGRSTAVAANIADCVDSNQDGVITTSQSPADIKPWGSDECILWSVVHASWSGSYTHGPRGITWTLGEWNEPTCSFINPKVWVGFLDGGGNGHLVKLNGISGQTEEDLVAPGWNGQSYAPYGGALDPEQRPWFTGLRGELVRVNTDQNPTTLTRIQQPGNIQTYGMTVDPNGNPWMAGCSGPVSTYDIQSQQWISVAGTSACHRGMAIDHNGHGWIASNGPCELVEVDTETRTLVAHHQLAQCQTAIGVSVDVDGYVWLVDQGGWAWKIDPDNVPGMQMIPVSGNHYVYSDMTGGQLKSVAQPPG